MMPSTSFVVLKLLGVQIVTKQLALNIWEKSTIFGKVFYFFEKIRGKNKIVEVLDCFLITRTGISEAYYFSVFDQ
jgi:hypothetical protein